jgi:5'-nucleotidase (lipoprotein e(P4) family)
MTSFFWGLSMLGLMAQNPDAESDLRHVGMADLRDGDLIFQEWDCGDGCSAIAGVTRSAYQRRLTHCGMFYRDAAGTLRVLEAVSRGVISTELQDFLGRTPEWFGSRVLVGRTLEGPAQIKTALDFALAQLGLPYDEVFEVGNQRWYCSELIDAAFAKATGDSASYFGLAPMTFSGPESPMVLPYWQHYFDSLGLPVPEGKPGINPGSISLSSKLNLSLLSADLIPGTMDAMLLSTLYVQRSAEYKALCWQSYQTAAQQLEILVDSVHRKHASDLKRRPPAVVLDLDETVLDNSLYAGWQIRHGAPYSSASWQTWVEQAGAGAVPGVESYLKTAQQRGLKILYLSNRKRSQWKATQQNLRALELPWQGLDSMWLRQEKNDKQARRDAIKSRYTVLQWVGDNLMDMDGFKVIPSAEDPNQEGIRDQALKAQVHRLGRDWILLPNPVYGPWEDLWHSELPPFGTFSAKSPTILDAAGTGFDLNLNKRKARLVQWLKFFKP